MRKIYGMGETKTFLKKKTIVCSECENWEKDPIPYNNIYFGVCKMDGQIKYEFHTCDFIGSTF
jgi:hypothetical protein